MDHDRLFKELIGTFFREFVELLLPEVYRFLDVGSLEPLDKELFHDVAAGERLEADVVVKGRFKGEETCFLVHVEHQAQPLVGFGRRMFRYFARLSEKYGLPVYPVALFSYERPTRAELDAFHVDFPNKRVLDFRYDVIQLNRLDWRAFVRNPNPVASALMARMAIAPEDRPLVKLECLRLLATLKLDPARMRLIANFVDVYLRLNEEQEAYFAAEVAALPGELKEEVMEYVTSWELRGRQLGAASMVRKVLERRFGALSQPRLERLERLSMERLEALMDASFDLPDLAAFDAWMATEAS